MTVRKFPISKKSVRTSLVDASKLSQSPRIVSPRFWLHRLDWLDWLDRLDWKSVIKEERGSLSILSTGLFLLLVLSSFVIMNASSAFLAKRELIQIGEFAITRAAQNLDPNSYYGNATITTALPIDCGAAEQSFRNEIAQSYLRQTAVILNEWKCDGFSASAMISSQVRHLLVMPILGSQGLITVSTEVAAHNALQK